MQLFLDFITIFAWELGLFCLVIIFTDLDEKIQINSDRFIATIVILMLCSSWIGARGC